MDSAGHSVLVLRMAGAVLLLRELDQLASTIPRCYAGIRSIGGLLLQRSRIGLPFPFFPCVFLSETSETSETLSFT